MTQISPSLRARLIGFSRGGETPNRTFRRVQARGLFESDGMSGWRLSDMGRQIANDPTPFEVDRANRLAVIRRALPHKLTFPARYTGDTFYDLQIYCGEQFGERATKAIDDKALRDSFDPAARWEVLLYYHNTTGKMQVARSFGDHCEIRFANASDACYLRMKTGPNGQINDE